MHVIILLGKLGGVVIVWWIVSLIIGGINTTTTKNHYGKKAHQSEYNFGQIQFFWGLICIVIAIIILINHSA